MIFSALLLLDSALLALRSSAKAILSAIGFCKKSFFHSSDLKDFF